MNLSIVTTCKGRLNLLKQTLPTWCDYVNSNCENAEIIVVDYACPDNTAEYVRKHFPGVNAVACDVKGFNLGHARNLGGVLAKYDWVLMIDCDVSITGLKWLSSVTLLPDQYYVSPLFGCMAGTCLVARDTIAKAGWYDDVINMYGAGYDDIELYQRLKRDGIVKAFTGKEDFKHLEHEGRTTHYPIKDRKLSDTGNMLYMCAKADSEAILHERLTRTGRRLLLDLVYASYADALETGQSSLSVDLSQAATSAIQIKRKLVFELKVDSLDRHEGAAAIRAAIPNLAVPKRS